MGVNGIYSLNLETKYRISSLKAAARLYGKANRLLSIKLKYSESFVLVRKIDAHVPRMYSEVYL